VVGDGQSDGRPVIDLGVVIVFDDAHAGLADAHRRFKIGIPDAHNAYREFTDLFAADLSEESMNWLADVRERDRSPVLRIPLWA